MPKKARKLSEVSIEGLNTPAIVTGSVDNSQAQEAPMNTNNTNNSNVTVAETRELRIALPGREVAALNVSVLNYFGKTAYGFGDKTCANKVHLKEFGEIVGFFNAINETKEGVEPVWAVLETGFHSRYSTADLKYKWEGRRVGYSEEIPAYVDWAYASEERIAMLGRMGIKPLEDRKGWLALGVEDRAFKQMHYITPMKLETLAAIIGEKKGIKDFGVADLSPMQIAGYEKTWNTINKRKGLEILQDLCAGFVQVIVAPVVEKNLVFKYNTIPSRFDGLFKSAEESHSAWVNTVSQKKVFTEVRQGGFVMNQPKNAEVKAAAEQAAAAGIVAHDGQTYTVESLVMRQLTFMSGELAGGVVTPRNIGEVLSAIGRANLFDQKIAVGAKK